MAVRVLNSGANVDSAIEIVADQEFDLTNRAGEDCVHRRIVDGFVTSDHGLVGAHGRDIRVKVVQNVGLEPAESSAEQKSGIGVRSGRIDVRQERCVGLYKSEGRQGIGGCGAYRFRAIGGIY